MLEGADPVGLEERAVILRGCGLVPSRVSVQRLERDDPSRDGARAWWYLLTDSSTGFTSGTSCLSGSSPQSELRWSAAQLAEYLQRANRMHQEVSVFDALSKLIPHESDTLLLTLARDGERWRVNVVPQINDAQLAEASTPLTLVSSLEDLETGFVDALERFSNATLPLMAQVEAAIAASQAAVEAAKQKASSKASSKPSSTGKPSSPAKIPDKAEPTKEAAVSSSGGLFDTASSDAQEPDLSETPPEPVVDEVAQRLADLQAKLKLELDGLTSERQALVLKLNSAANAAFELETAFVVGSDELEPPMRTIPLGKRYLEVMGRLRVLEDRGVEALEEAA
ncbi:MAG: PRTRC system protein E [Pleurocapsa sp. SU_196_0]|nr:PRTRC system protein E [Pleurocapsa sp. SU_196_0]